MTTGSTLARRATRRPRSLGRPGWGLQVPLRHRAAGLGPRRGL